MNVEAHRARPGAGRRISGQSRSVFTRIGLTLPNGQFLPALALGNTVVHKPSDRTPSAATWIARCFAEAGLPKGVFNVVQGGAAAGVALATHRDVDGVMFIGSVDVGRRLFAS